jgi:hypothetical protein
MAGRDDAVRREALRQAWLEIRAIEAAHQLRPSDAMGPLEPTGKERSLAAPRALLWILLPVVVLLAASIVFRWTTPGTAAESTGHNSHGRPRWDVAQDFRIVPNQANTSPDRMGDPVVWSYRYSPTGQENPAAYQLLPEFDTDKLDVQGLESRSGTNVSLDEHDLLPAVGINATGHDVSPPVAPDIHWPAGVVLVHPWWGQPVVIGWRSPVTGTIFVAGNVSLAQQPNCGDGIDWALDLESTVLAHGTVQQFQRNTWSLPVHVSKGQSLYLIVSPGATIYCDSTLVDLTVTKGQQ